MNDPANELFNEHLDELKTAGAKMAIAASLAYKHDDPESYLKMKAAFDRGLAEIGVTLFITPRPHVEVFATGPDGRRHVFFSMGTKELDGTGPLLN